MRTYLLPQIELPITYSNRQLKLHRSIPNYFNSYCLVIRYIPKCINVEKLPSVGEKHNRILQTLLATPTKRVLPS